MRVQDGERGDVLFSRSSAFLILSKYCWTRSCYGKSGVLGWDSTQRLERLMCVFSDDRVVLGVYALCLQVDWIDGAWSESHS